MNWQIGKGISGSFQGTPRNVIMGNNLKDSNFTIHNYDQSQAELRRKCLEALIVSKKIDDQTTILGKMGETFYPEVAEWILERPEYKQWVQDKKKSGLLWVRGHAGTGKTMLTIAVSEYLEKLWQGNDQNLVVCQFCETLAKGNRSPIFLLRTLMWNMINKWGLLYDHLEKDWLDAGEKLFNATSISAMWRILNNMWRSMSGKTVYFIIDSLDVLTKDVGLLRLLIRHMVTFTTTEIPQPTSPDSREPLPRHTTNLHLTSTDNHSQRCAVKILLVSRQATPAWLDAELGSIDHIDLDRYTNAEFAGSIRKYIELQLKKTSKFKGMTAKQQQETMELFDQRQDTSFIAANDTIRHYASIRSPNVPDLIIRRPTSLAGMYTQALVEIPVHLRSRCASLMKWVAVSWRPLNIDEVSDGLSFAAGPQHQDAFTISAISEILEKCKNFLCLEPDGLAFVHQSALDFLFSTQWSGPPEQNLDMFKFNEVKVEMEITKVCVKYLSDTTNFKNPIDIIEPGFSQMLHLEKHAFLPYAILYWPFHARAASLNPEFYASHPFFSSKSKRLDAWWSSYAMSSAKKGWKWLVTRNFSPLHIACHFGLLGLAQYLEEQGLLQKYMTQHDSNTVRPLDYAIESREVRMVEYLLQYKAPVEDEKYGYDSLIHAAAEDGDLEMLEMLLRVSKIHVDVTCRDLSWKSFTPWGILLSHPRMVGKALFDQKPRLTEHNGPRPTSAEVGSDTGLVNTGKYYGKKPVAGFGTMLRPFHLAANQGHEHVLRFLQRRGASTTAPTSLGWTPLHCAALTGQQHILRLLIEDFDAGDTLEALTTEHWSPLHCAAASHVREGAQYLLQKGAIVNRLNKKKKTPLHIAVQHNHVATAMVLLNYDANVEIIDHKGRSPLFSAQERNLAEMVQILINAGADSSPIDKNGQTVFERAVKARQYEIVAILQKGPLSPPDDSTSVVEADLEEEAESEELEEQSEEGVNDENEDTRVRHTSKADLEHSKSPPESGDNRNVDSDAKVAATFGDMQDSIAPAAESLPTYTENIVPQEVPRNDNDTKTNPGPSSSPSQPADEPLGKVLELFDFFMDEIRPACLQFISSPPSQLTSRRLQYVRLSERILGEVMAPLDELETGGDAGARAVRKQVIDRCNAILDSMDQVDRRNLQTSASTSALPDKSRPSLPPRPSVPLPKASSSEATDHYSSPPPSYSSLPPQHTRPSGQTATTSLPNLTKMQSSGGRLETVPNTRQAPVLPQRSGQRPLLPSRTPGDSSGSSTPRLPPALPRR